MGKINITDIKEALVSGHCFHSITGACCDMDSSNYYTTKKYAVFEIDINNVPYRMLVPLGGYDIANDSLAHSIRIIGIYRDKNIFGSCAYMPGELRLMDYAGSTCDVILIRREEGNPIRMQVHSDHNVKELLSKTGELVCRLAETGITIGGDLFNHIIVKTGGTPFIQASSKIRVLAPGEASKDETQFFYRTLALNMFFLWCRALKIVIDKEDIEYITHCMTRKNDLDRLYDILTRYCNQIQAIYSIGLGAFVKTVVTGDISPSLALIGELKKIKDSIHTDSCPLHIGGDHRQRETGTINYLDNSQYRISMVHCEDRIGIMNNETGLWGFIDYYGTLMVDFKYHVVNDFDEGYAIVVLDEKAGVINRFGETILPIKYDNIEWNSYDNVFHVSQNGKHDLLDREGVRITNETYRSLGPFYHSLAVIEDHQKYKGYISNTGQVIVPPVYIDAIPFKDVTASVQTEDGKWHRIDLNGKLLD